MKIFLMLFFITTSVFAIDPMAGYQTSNIKDQNVLNNIFKDLYQHRRRSSTTQCFERAHVWSYQMFVNQNIYSEKVFIYFTRKFIREINGDWWFHVAPGVLYNSELYMLDPEFLNRPVPFTMWKNGAIDHAIKKLTPIKINYEREITALNKEKENLNSSRRRDRKRINYINNRIQWLQSELERMLIDKVRVIPTDEHNWPYKDGMKSIVELDCPFITNYSEYKQAQESAYCYIQKTNMYVWEPSELEKLEEQDTNKTEFVPSEVYTSFKKAFRGRFPFRL